jgi:hypothetical protein
MKKNIFDSMIIFFGVGIFILSSCSVTTSNPEVKQDNSYSKPGHMYFKELPDQSPDNTDDMSFTVQNQWSKITNDVSVSLVSSNTRFTKNLIPKISLQDTCIIKAWRGEKVNAQILIWTKIDIPKLSVEVEKLVSDKGKSIESENIKPGFVRYVMTNPGYGQFGNYASLTPDPIDIIPDIPVNKNTVQPVWLNINVPEKIESGTYRGKINVIADKKYTLWIILDVSDHVLPPPEEWKYDLDLWQHPAAIARVHNVALWSDEHFKILRPYYNMLARAGQKVITASIVDEPWDHQTYDDYPGLIRCNKKTDGSWVYDYSLFDKYVEFVMSCGINKGINCYTLTKFTYYDEGSEKILTSERSSSEYKGLCTLMLKDFTKHLKEKGWFKITAIAMDESPLPVAREVIEMIKKVDPDWKLALAGTYHPEIEKDLFDYCLFIGAIFPDSVLSLRKEEGKPRTFYTCCGPDFPNGFTFSPPAEQVWFGWYAANMGFTGYLRWAYNSWPANPLRDSRFPKYSWPAGDTYQIYPGPRSSMRFEKLIEGIQDFEKIRIIRALYSKNGSDEKLLKLEEAIKTFTYGNDKMKNFNSEELVVKAQEILNDL